MASTVRDFYNHLPFNQKKSVQAHSRDIRNDNAVENYPVLPPLLRGGKASVLEVGCGTGWLSNSVAYHYGNTVTAIDLSSAAIDRATAVASDLGTDVNFQTVNLFDYRPPSPFDLVVSIGVLHHTYDCHGALAGLCRETVSQGGHAFIGLYHSYGRKPFLDHFADLKAKGLSDEALMKRFSELCDSDADSVHLESWFRDQVLHPHETQHSLEEICGLLDNLEMTLVSTSINRFQPFDNQESLFEIEKTYTAVAQAHLENNEYFPGFFVFLLERTSSNA